MASPADVDLGPLPAGYRALFDRAFAVLEADERVLAVWLSGSLARGGADAQSDLDLLVATSDEGFKSFGESWAEWLAAITATVLAKRIPVVSGLYSVTPEWLRLDVVWEARAALVSTFFRERRLVFDRGGCAGLVPPPVPAAGPSAPAVLALVEECWRMLGLMPTAIGRKDWLLGIEGIHLQRLLLYNLLQQANAPLPTTGLKQWSSKLTREQIAAFESLPTGAPAREALIEGTTSVVRMLLREARPLAARLGVAWPDALEHATRLHLRRELGVELDV
jgi:hypothetical protein